MPTAVIEVGRPKALTIVSRLECITSIAMESRLERVALPQPRRPRRDLERLEAPVGALADSRLEELVARVEPPEHVDEDVPATGLLGADDPVRVGDRGRERKLAEDVLPGLERPDDVVGVHRGRQAHVDEGRSTRRAPPKAASCKATAGVA